MVRQILSLVLLAGVSFSTQAERTENDRYSNPKSVRAKAAALHRVKRRAPASMPAGMGLSFDAYLNANSSHPALNSQPGKIPGHQEAFKDFSKPAVISFPSDSATPLAAPTAAPPTGSANLPGATPLPSAPGPASSSSSSSGSPLQ